MLRTITTATLAVLALSGAAQAMKAQDLDINGDHFITKSEIATIFPGFTSADFNIVDVNRDGRLSAKEAQDAETRQVIQKYEPTAKVLFGLSEVDANGDRFVSEGELAGVYGGVSRTEFLQIDANRDGRVSAPELYASGAQALLRSHGPNVSSAALPSVQDVDTDGDSFASFDELTATFPSLSAFDLEEIDLNGDNRVSFVEYNQGKSILRR